MEVNSITESTAAISWGTNEAADSQVRFGASALNLDMQTQIQNIESPVTSHTILLSGLTPGTEYFFLARSRDASENVGSSAILSFTTLDNSGPEISNVSVGPITENAAVVTWTTDEPADSQVLLGSGLANLDLRTTIADQNPRVINHSVTVSPLEEGTRYFFQVRSRDSSGNPSVSPLSDFETPDDTAPVISNVRADRVTNATATIKWSTDEPSDSQVEFGLDETFGQLSPLNANRVTEHTVTLRGLSPGTTYFYRVMSTDEANNIGLSPDFTFDVRPLMLSFNPLLPQTIEPLQQPTFTLQMQETFPSAIDGQVQINFLSTATNPADDPSIQFALGGRTLDFTIPANRREAAFANLPAFQTGTVQGNIRLSVRLLTIPSPDGPRALDLSPIPRTTTIVPPRAPVVTQVRVENQTESGFDVIVSGYSTTRAITGLSFRFTAKDEKTKLDPDTAVLPGAEEMFTQWYQDPQSAEFGSQFILSVPFAIDGNVGLLGTVAVTATNEMGPSEEVEGSF